MDLYVFMDAVELLVQKLYPYESAKGSAESLSQFLQCAQARGMSPSKK